MIIFGSIEALRNSKSRVVINSLHNFNTLFESIPQLMWLNPYRMNQYNGNTNCYEFDIWYANYIGTNQNAFREFIDIMRDIYNGANVWILCDFSTETGYNVIESLIKYITEQYGYTCNVCITPDDTENLVEGDFSPLGIQAFDSHLESYLQNFGYRGLASDPE